VRDTRRTSQQGPIGAGSEEKKGPSVSQREREKRRRGRELRRIKSNGAAQPTIGKIRRSNALGAEKKSEESGGVEADLRSKIAEPQEQRSGSWKAEERGSKGKGKRKRESGFLFMW